MVKFELVKITRTEERKNETEIPKFSYDKGQISEFKYAKIT